MDILLVKQVSFYRGLLLSKWLSFSLIVVEEAIKLFIGFGCWIIWILLRIKWLLKLKWMRVS